MRHLRTLAACVTLAAASTGPRTASAYTQYLDGGVPFAWASPGGVPIHYAANVAAIAQTYTAIEQGFLLFNWNPTSLWFELLPDDDEEQVSGNGENEIAFTTDAETLDGHPAITYYWWLPGGEIVETDIYLDANVAWTDRDAKRKMMHYGGTRRPLDAVVMHELGHCGGLDHEDGLYSIMGTEWTHSIANGMRAVAHLGSDTSAGLVATYGGIEGYDNLSITHWEYVGAADGYAFAQRTRVTDLWGGAVTTRTAHGEPMFEVTPGQTFAFGFTMENSGLDVESVQATVVLSYDPRITLADRVLGGTPVDLWPGDPVTDDWGITIPDDLTMGLYYVGVVLDSAGELPEIQEEDNATYVAILVAN